MKSLLITTALLALLAACGKDNKSGKNSAPPAPGVNTLCYNGANCPYTTNQYSTQMFGNFSVNMIIGETPCMDSSQTHQRTMLPAQITVQTVIPTGDVYAGITSYGDIGILIGNGTNQPRFEAYVCNRSYASLGNIVQASALSIGSYTGCQFKPISALRMYVNNQVELNFRMLDFGHAVYPSGQLTKYTFCQ